MDNQLQIVIRELKPADYQRLASFFEENNKIDITRNFNPFPLNLESAKSITCTHHRDRYYAALLGERIIGFSMLRGWEEGYTVPSFGILIDYHFYNRGIGKDMLKFTIKEARRFGCQNIRLSVYASNLAAVRMYTTEGFIEHSRFSVIILGETEEKITMFKEL